MAKARKPKKILLWAGLGAGLLLLYYTGSSVWAFVSVKRQKAQLERECLYLKARTLAVEFRSRALRDPEVIRLIATKRLGMRDTSFALIRVPDPQQSAQERADSVRVDTTQAKDQGSSQ